VQSVTYLLKVAIAEIRKSKK